MDTPQTLPEDLPQFLTVEGRGTFMRIGRSSAYGLIRRGVVPAFKWGRTVVQLNKHSLIDSLEAEVYESAGFRAGACLAPPYNISHMLSESH
jgi:hypothetical protein